MSLRIRFVLLLVAALVPAVLVTVWTGVDQRRQATRDIEQSTLRLARLASAEQEQLMLATRQLLAVMGRFPELDQNDTTACSQRFAEVANDYPYYTSLVAMRPNGDFFCSSAPLPQSLSATDQSYFQRAVSSGSFSLGDYTIGRISGKAIVVAAYPVKNSRGEIQRVVSAGIDLSWLGGLASRTQLPLGSELTVADAKGTILVRYPDPSGVVGQQLPLFAGAAGSQGESVVEAVGPDGQHKVFAFVPLGSSSGAMDLYASVAVPTAVAFGPADELLRRNLGTLAFCALVGIGIAWFGGKLLILGGVDDLVRTAKQLTTGDLSTRTNTSYQDSELGEVAKALDELAVAFERLIETHEGTEDALRENEERYRAVIENVAEAIAISVGTTRVFVNKAFLNIHGLSDPSEVLGLPTDHFVFPEDRGPLRERVLARLRGESVPISSEFRINRPSGEIRTVLASTVSINYEGQTASLAVLRDITDRKRDDETIKASETRYRSLFERMPVGLYRTTPEGQIFDVNPALARVLGYPDPNDMLNVSAFDLYVNSAERKRLQARLDHDGVVENYETRMYKYDKAVFWAKISARSILDEEGNVEYYEGSIEDITIRKRAEEDLQELNKDLELRVKERTGQLELLNTELRSFAYSVSHDLRAPLHSIDGFSQALLEDYGEILDHTGKDYARRVRAAAQRMGGLIDDLLLLSRVTRSELRRDPVDLSGLVRTIADELQEAEPNRRVDFVIQHDLTVVGDPQLLRLMMENLVGNSWKFTSKHLQARIEFGCEYRDGEPVYFLRDDGAGFNMDYVDKLFGAFQRLHTTDDFPGTGIGLATVQRIATRHQGKVWAEGEVERGATVYFTL